MRHVSPENSTDDARKLAYYQAAEWYMLMQERSLDAQQQTCFEQWLAADILHQEVWSNVIMFNDKMGRLSTTVLAKTIYKLKVKQNLAVKFGLTLFAMCSALYMIQGVRQQDCLPELFSFDPIDIYKTRIGEQQQVTLTDGSQIWLNSHSKIRVKYNTKQRRIELAQGEVYIETHKDVNQRPFRVQTPHGNLLALGTAFNVRNLTDQTELIVTQGIVRTQPQDSRFYQDIYAQHVIRFNGTQIYHDSYSDMPLLWRQQLLVVHSMPLQKFIAELSRYHQEKIDIDPSLQNVLVSGAYSTQDLPRTLNMLQATYHFKIVHTEQKTFYIQPFKKISINFNHLDSISIDGH